MEYLANDNISSSKQDDASYSYVFPKSEEIIISKSDLQIQLDKFKKKIQENIGITELLALISIWLPVFTADFKPIFGLQQNQMAPAYAMVALCISVPIVYRWLVALIHVFGGYKDVSGDPEEMASKILYKCCASKKK